MADKIDELYIQIESDSSIATKAIGKLVSSLKVLKKELGSGFNSSVMNSAVKSFDNVKSKMRDLSKDSSLDKLSEKLKKATDVKTDSLEKYKKSLKGLNYNISVPSTFNDIEKRLKELVPQYEKLIEKQNKAIATNNGMEPDTKSYRNMLFDLQKVVAETHELSKARLSMSAAEKTADKSSNSDVDAIIQKLQDKRKAYEQVTGSVIKANKAESQANKVPVDDPSSRLKDFMKQAEEGQRDYSSKIAELSEKAAANVRENFNLSETIKGNESALNSLINRLGAVKESLQQSFDLSKIEAGSKAWETYQYRIAATAEKIELVKENLAAINNNNKKFTAADAFSENMDKVSGKVSEIWKKAYENIDQNFKIPSSIKELEKLIPSLEKSLDKLHEKFQSDIDTGKVEEGSKAWDNYEYKIGVANAKLDITKKKLSEIRSLENQMANSDVVPSVEPVKAPTGKSSADITAKSLAATVSFATLSKYIGQFSKSLDRLGGKMSGVLSTLYAPLRHMVAEYKSKLGQIGNIFKSLSNVVEKAANKIRVKWNNLVHSFSKMVMRRALYAVLTTINDAMGSLANFVGTTGQRFNAAMSDMSANARYAGANIVAAFSPLVNAIAPMIDALVEKMVQAITVMNQFFAALTGQSVYVKAKKVVTDYADSVKKATKAQKDLVLGIDELNINSPDKNTDAGGAAGAGDLYEWEEAPVLKGIKDFADKVKDIFKKLFDPLKKAWDKAGDYVISGFKYMVSEIGKLAAAIGKDFLTMWQEEETVRIFENILGIIGDIEYTIGNLARNFREAWQENNVGLDIFRNMRDIVGILIEHVREVTRYMKEWSETVDFTPMLTTFRDMLESLKPVADFVGGVFEDVMKNVVIRYIDYMIEDGIPHLNSTIASIADAFDWQKMRSDMLPVEEAFANLAIAIHEGAVNALGNLGQALAGITNTETFTKFMENVAKIINLIDADLVEKVLTALGNCILKVGDALVKFVGSDSFSDFIDDVDEWLDNLTVEDIENIIGGLAGAIIGFKFTSFIGSGFANFIKFLNTIANLGNLGGAAGTLSGVATAISNIGLAFEAGGGIALIAKHYIDEIKAFKSNIDAEDVPGAIVSALEIAEPESTGQIISEELREVLEAIDVPGKVDELVSTITGTDNSLYSKLWKFFHHDLPDMFDFQGKLTDHVIKVATGKVKSLRDLNEEYRQDSENKWEEIRKTVTEKSKEIWDKVTENFTSLKSTATKLWGDVKDNVTQKVSELSGNISQKWSDIKANISKVIGEISDNVTGKWSDIKTNVGKTIDELGESAGEKWGRIKENLGEKVKEIGENIGKKWSDIKEDVGKKIGDIWVNAEKVWTDIKDTISTKVNDIWDNVTSKFEKIANDMKEKIEGAKDAVKEAIDKIKDLFNFEWKWPDLSLPHFRIEGEFNLMEGRIPHIEVDWYANGGFLGAPRSYSLFGMGENGIPEILGTVGGRSAVAGGEEITGIREQVYESGMAEQALLGQAISLLQVIADKDFNVDLDGRSMVSALNSRSTRNGYSMATIS